MQISCVDVFKLKIMKNLENSLAMTVLYGLFSIATLSAQGMSKSIIVGSAEMYPAKNIVENALNSGAHTILVTANISVYDVMQSNGAIHSVDTVLIPE